MPSNADQIKLLELQGLDSSLAKLRHERQTDPSIAEVKTLESKLAALNKSLLAAKTAVSDQQREVAKVQGFIDEANARIVRNQQKIDKGDLNHKDTLAVSEEMTSLVNRIAELEDDQLEVMERHEACVTAEAQVAQAHQDIADALTKAIETRDQTLENITNQGRAVIGQRDQLAREIDPTLVSQYDKLRTRLNGVGAARYWGGRCEGCGLELPPGEQEKIAKAEPDRIVTCDDCGRILIRVPQ
jgi:uncharacterized protein